MEETSYILSIIHCICTGHALLERYGMTEAGMVLSNLYRGHREPVRY